jgi:hypothetical protein
MCTAMRNARRAYEPCSASVHRSFPASSNFGRLCAIRPCIFGASSLTSLRRRRIPSGAYVKDSRGIACSTKSRIIERSGSRADSRTEKWRTLRAAATSRTSHEKIPARSAIPPPPLPLLLLLLPVASSNRSPCCSREGAVSVDARMRLTHSLTVNYVAWHRASRSIDGRALCESETHAKPAQLFAAAGVQ